MSSAQESMDNSSRHFLVVAAASRGARYFIKNAIRQGHDVTAICRAENDAMALKRMTDLLQKTHLTPEGVPSAPSKGTLQATCSDILHPETYENILVENPSIDALCCFVGATQFKDMVNPEYSIYTDTMASILEGMRRSRWVEVFYHGSVGSEGRPGDSKTSWPANYPHIAKFIPLFFPVFKNVIQSEHMLAHAEHEGLRFVIFRPAALHDKAAKRQYGYTFDTTSFETGDLPLKYAKHSISREDCAEEILRVATLSPSKRTEWHGHGVYLVDRLENKH